MPAPPGDLIELNFSVTLSPPSGGSIPIDFNPGAAIQYITGVTLGAQGGMTAPVIFNSLQFLSPSGWDSGNVPGPLRVTTPQFLATTGFTSAVVSNAAVTFGLQVKFTSALSVPPGSALILEFSPASTPSILGVTLGSQFASGMAAIGQPPGIRPYGFASSEVGVPAVESTIRYLEPSPFVSSVIGAQTIYNNARIIGATGLVPTAAFGDPWVSLFTRTAAPYGFEVTTYGSATIWNRTLDVLPNGIPPYENFGTTSLFNNAAVILPGGIPRNTAYGTAWIDYRTRTVTGAGNIVSGFSLTNAHHIAHWVQYVEAANQGIPPFDVGAPTVTFAVRNITPISFVGPYWGSHAVKRRIFVEPVGWDSSFISQNAALLINTRLIYVLTGEADPAKYGTASIINQRQDVSLHNNGWQSSHISFPVIYNLKREVFVGPFAENVDPTSWTNYYPVVENKDRILGAFGHQSSRVGLGAWIRNNAEPVYPVGTEMTQWGAGTFISHRDRTIFGQGWDSFYSTQFSVIWNTADILAPYSLGDTSAFGRPDPVANLNREVRHHSGWVGPEFGVPFIAYRIRYVYPNVFYDVPASFPEVRHDPHPLAPVGIPWQGQVGGHEVRIFRREAFPHSVNVHDPWIGEAIVRNRNIESTTYGYMHTEFGATDIQNYIRYLAPVWVNPDLIPTPLIGYRTRTAYPAPLSIPVFSVLHRIFNNDPDPPSLQRILLNMTDIHGDVIDGYGIAPPGMTAPVVKLATIYPAGIDETAKFGSHTVRSNVLAPRFIFEDGLFGVPAIYLNTRYMFPQSLLMTEAVGLARFSPWNIYAPQGDARPDGYTPYNVFATVIGAGNNSSFDNSAFPWFGRATVTNKNRVIGPVPMRGADPINGFDYYPKFGVPSATLRRQYVRPTGIRSLRFGQIIFWGVPQYVDLDDVVNRQGIDNDQQWGDAQVAYPPIPPDPNRYAYPAGNVMTAIPNTHRVELFNRTVYPAAIPHAGGSSGTNPWGVPLVGYPRQYVVGMGSQTLWGNAVIEYKNRWVLPKGWNNSSLENNNFEDYRFRMRVTRRNPPVTPVSISSGISFGNVDVSHRNRTVYSRGVGGYNSGSHTVAHV